MRAGGVTTTRSFRYPRRMCPLPGFLVAFLFWLMRTTREEWMAKRHPRAEPQAHPAEG